MKKVFKYPIPIEDSFTLELPRYAEILKIECQDGRPYLWALVRPLSETRTRHFRLAGTGHPIHEENLTHLATFQMEHGALVWHVFEVQP